MKAGGVGKLVCNGCLDWLSSECHEVAVKELVVALSGMWLFLPLVL
jgi:hypothetical protein